MERRSFITSSSLLLAGFALGGQAEEAAAQARTANRAAANRGWTTLLDGTSMNGWSPIGNANWRVNNGVVEADSGNGFLVSQNTYGDVQIRAEFWVDGTANSGIFIRCSDPSKITAENAYEVNIFDTRPDPSYGTGAIVNVAKVVPMPKAANKWNQYDITAKGNRFTVVLNGQRTVNGATDVRHARGWIGLQYAGGVVRFRKVDVRSI
ncbi:MAG: DUF1080 domain-containing protein [Alphaproteobacteria bacterium]|nr:DUF1080 domain-containing protein [Alphaproteobacteria bacterium]